MSVVNSLRAGGLGSLLIAMLFCVTLPAVAGAEDVAAVADTPTVEKEAAAVAREPAPLEDVDAMWTVLAAILVFFMQAGFTCVESGFTRAKNACNIVMKNVMDMSIGSLAFWLVGFGLMFGASSSTGGFVGTDNFMFDATTESAALGKVENTGWAFLLFQTVFCATAATIVSGAIAERTKFGSYLLITLFVTAVIYPIFGAWAWGGLWAGNGWLEQRGFLDFAGSTVVHSIGGWCALAGAIVLGPRLGKYAKNGKVMPIPGHNIPVAALGVFILWLGWFGFNAGSTTEIRPDGASFAYICVTTNLAAAAGALGAMLVSWAMFKKPDPSFALNGVLAGLVAITAGCDALSPQMAALTGLLGGMIVVFSVLMFDKIKIDDPVGAISVHGICGAWGTLAVGLFATESGLLLGHGPGQLLTQLIGIGAAFVWAFPVSLLAFFAIKVVFGLRVSEEVEREGLDVAEHGMYAYPPGFVSDTVSGSPAAPLPAIAGTGSGAAVPSVESA